MGLKLFVVCALAMLMSIPMLLLYALVSDRNRRADEVKTDIGKYVGGPQTFLGPTLAIPYTTASPATPGGVKRDIYLVSPARASGVVKTATEERHRSLFRVPVYQAIIDFDASFDLSRVPGALPEGAELDWTRAEFVIGVSDPHSATADATVTIDGKTLTIAPALTLGSLMPEPAGDQNERLTMLGTNSNAAIKPGATIHVKSTLKFSGAQRISVLAYGKTTELTMSGAWRDPSFDGSFLPVSRTVTDTGFTARWFVPFIARGVRAEGPAESFTGLNTTALSTSFIELADPYQSMNRSLKYAPLFLGLVFLSYFIFEITTGRLVHPAQYILVGLAQTIFYLLLLAFAERTGFDLAFLIAGAATVGLLSINAGWVFASHLQGLRALAMFGTLYSLIYLLLRLEDNALLVGSVASFLAIAAAMYLTRNINWYSQRKKIGVEE